MAGYRLRLVAGIPPVQLLSPPAGREPVIPAFARPSFDHKTTRHPLTVQGHVGVGIAHQWAYVKFSLIIKVEILFIIFFSINKIVGLEV